MCTRLRLQPELADGESSAIVFQVVTRDHAHVHAHARVAAPWACPGQLLLAEQRSHGQPRLYGSYGPTPGS